MQELSTRYNPKEVENKWYKFWEEKKLFEVSTDSPKKPYCIVIPPPNITGSLHMGHALDETLQDILIAVSKVRIERKTLVKEAENEAVHQMQKMEGREPVLCEEQTQRRAELLVQEVRT